MAAGKFNFDSYGIGELLRRGSLAVPANQRSYKWGEPQVENLLLDLNEAILSDEEDYFLGTIVLIQRGSEVPSIVDGQQRLATTSVLLARIRDKQAELKRLGRAESIEKSFLRDIDLESEERVPRLELNVEDNAFFVNYILANAEERRGMRPVKAMRASNRRLLQASVICEQFINDELKNIKIDSRSDHLNRWVNFIKNNASVVVVTAPDEVGAFRMFETLNDRGLKAGAADILKNYFFSRSGNRLKEAQDFWNYITTSIEALGDEEDDRLVTFLRHFWVVKNGPTKERELARKIKSDIVGETKALSFLEEASRSVDAYVALWSSQHPFWSDHRTATRGAVDTIANQLKVEQIRPLLFAVALHFEPREAEKAFKMFVSWSVRFLVFGWSRRDARRTVLAPSS
ncbi:DUF262 domain-containing protein [Sphingomonas sp. SORGH_AS_0438]|uniref:DUF262 domain-containing protein n=1 Tax=Sphingomonas sp. SORGH_AS_0438 TaxID=3041756 RepID=UPI002859BA3A|nr:DUF262 domain-containing protein [Sphingomonas sp. SORGH_AS_0438]MDR6127391.1 uncharacterized protein with ParB-like and HNH nuclease domain [Sphingomonas sp. SORGH_AS_0438]